MQLDSGISSDTGGPMDSGAVDTGIVADATPNDTGEADANLVDAGPPGRCPAGTEGCACTEARACAGGMTCLNTLEGFAPTPEQGFYICVRECTADAECTASEIGNGLCRSVFGETQACVSGEVTEGLVGTISRVREDAPMIGCEAGLVGVPRWVGSVLQIEDDQISCGRPCDPNGAATCTATHPYCNPNVAVGTNLSGVCVSRQASAGDICSASSVVGLCDNSVGTLVCIGTFIDYTDPVDPSPEPRKGLCMELCDPNAGGIDCVISDDPVTGPASCGRLSGSSNLGVCSTPCEIFPNSCTRPGAFGVGSACSGARSLPGGDPLSLCLGTIAPAIPEFDFRVPPATDCTDPGLGSLHCEAGTICAQGPDYGICIRTCSTTAPTGCENNPTGNINCDDEIITGDGDGLGACVPF